MVKDNVQSGAIDLALADIPEAADNAYFPCDSGLSLATPAGAEAALLRRSASAANRSISTSGTASAYFPRLAI